MVCMLANDGIFGYFVFSLKEFPAKEAAEIALRTIRRFLETDPQANSVTPIIN